MRDDDLRRNPPQEFEPSCQRTLVGLISPQSRWLLDHPQQNFFAKQLPGFAGTKRQLQIEGICLFDA
jgi:hypothetical protein